MSSFPVNDNADQHEKAGLPENGSMRGFAMETKEINSTSWEAFCRKLQEMQPRTRLTIERLERGGHRVPVVNNLELREARLDRNGACNDLMNFTLAEDNGETVEYVITEPLHIKLRQQESDRYSTIEIIAEDGTHIVSARPGFRQDLIADLQ
jgi:hypothetical protein